MSNVKGIEVYDLFGFSEPVTKLIETIRSAIGTWYAPVGVRRLAKAKAFELQTVSEALNSNLNLPTEYSDGKITINTQDYDELVKRTGNRLFYQEMKKQQNIEAIVELASVELEKEESVSSEPVDQDWTIRFFNSVEDVSNEEMQKIWGQVLAGEVKHPTSFSLRTLEKLSNMSQREATLFKEYTKYCIYDTNYPSHFMIPSEESVCDKFGLYIHGFVILSECGLINMPNLLYTLKLNDSMKIQHLANGGLVSKLQSANEVDSEICFGVYTLTRTGAELYRIIDKSSNDEFFLDFLDFLRNPNNPYNLQKQKIRIEAYKIIQMTDSGILWDDANNLLTPKDD